MSKEGKWINYYCYYYYNFLLVSMVQQTTSMNIYLCRKAEKKLGCECPIRNVLYTQKRNTKLPVLVRWPKNYYKNWTELLKIWNPLKLCQVDLKPGQKKNYLSKIMTWLVWKGSLEWFLKDHLVGSLVLKGSPGWLTGSERITWLAIWFWKDRLVVKLALKGSPGC